METASIPAAEGTPAQGRSEARWRVVLVDDHAALRRLYRTALNHAPDFAVVGEAPDGAAAMQRAPEFRPDLVLLDLSMPNMDGLETLIELRKRFPKAHVVILSGFNRDKMAELVLPLGATEYIEKGIDPRQLGQRLAEIMTRPLPKVLEEIPPDFLQRARKLI